MTKLIRLKTNDTGTDELCRVLLVVHEAGEVGDDDAAVGDGDEAGTLPRDDDFRHPSTVATEILGKVSTGNFQLFFSSRILALAADEVAEARVDVFAEGRGVIPLAQGLGADAIEVEDVELDNTELAEDVEHVALVEG